MMRTRYIRLVPLFAAAIMLLAGCARPFPSEITDRVDRKISFSALQKDPGRFKGKWVMFAGVIVSSMIEKDGSTYIEVVQKPADSFGEPLRTDESGGRFIAVSKQFLDPAVYQGRVITVVGEVVGDSVRPLGEMAYRYPLISVEALHLWEPSYGPSSSFSFGVGVGVFHGH
ncbi:MAG TPA: Slp family lipoprotein [Nitrospirota bacterium]|nr:Slp family lipoprotein [Nitrospirota bacterium]